MMTREAMAIIYALEEVGDMEIYAFLECVRDGDWAEIPRFVDYCDARGVDVYAPERDAAKAARIKVG